MGVSLNGCEIEMIASYFSEFPNVNNKVTRTFGRLDTTTVMISKSKTVSREILFFEELVASCDGHKGFGCSNLVETKQQN